MGFDYYYGTEADQFSFIRIPKALLTEERFSSLSIQAKLLYGLLLDRMGLSAKNGWLDKENRVYIIYQISEIQEDLGFSKKKAIDYLGELEALGLVEKKRRGLGLPTILYVKNFITGEMGTSRSVEMGTSEKDESRPVIVNYEDYGEKMSGESAKTATYNQAFAEKVSRSVEMGTSRSVDLGTSRSVEMGTSGGAEIALQEVSKTSPQNNTNNNNTNMIQTDSNHIVSFMDDLMGLEDINQRRQYFWMKLDMDILMQSNPLQKELLEGMYELVLEICLFSNNTILIAGNEYPADIVKERFLRLEASHLQYVLDCLRDNTSKIHNIKKYILAALYNAPVTIDGYYMAEVNHDFAMGVFA